MMNIILSTIVVILGVVTFGFLLVVFLAYRDREL